MKRLKKTEQDARDVTKHPDGKKSVRPRSLTVCSQLKMLTKTSTKVSNAYNNWVNMSFYNNCMPPTCGVYIYLLYTRIC